MTIVSLLPRGSFRHCPCCPHPCCPHFLCRPCCPCLPCPRRCFLAVPSAGASCPSQLPVYRQHAPPQQTQDPLQPLVHQCSRCCHSWLLTSLWLIVTSSVITLAPTPSSHCCSRHHCCHCIVIISHPATLIEKSLLKKEKAGKVMFYLRRPDSDFQQV
jgi:hypothetical protein